MISDHRFGIKNKNYDNYWEQRMEKNRTGFSPIHKRILELAKRYTKPQARVLDMGVGPGQVFKELQKNFKAYGVEISDEAFKLYDFPHETIKKGNLEEAIPNFPDVPDNKFDFIVASHIVHHFDDPEGFIEMVKQNLSDDGKLLVATPNVTFINFRLRYMFAGQFPDLSRSHISFLTPTDYRRVFADKGYDIVTTAGLPHYPLLSENMPSLFSPTLFYVLKKR